MHHEANINHVSDGTAQSPLWADAEQDLPGTRPDGKVPVFHADIICRQTQVPDESDP